MKHCKNCDKPLEKGRRVYCCNLCAIEYHNRENKPIMHVDKWGRKYLCCGKCKRRLRKIDYRGKTKLICHNCYKKNTHKSKDDSQFIEKKINEDIMVRLEITKNNRNWHYVDGKPVMGFKNALNYFKIKCYNLEKRFNRGTIKG